MSCLCTVCGSGWIRIYAFVIIFLFIFADLNVCFGYLVEADLIQYLKCVIWALYMPFNMPRAIALSHALTTQTKRAHFKLGALQMQCFAWAHTHTTDNVLFVMNIFFPIYIFCVPCVAVVVVVVCDLNIRLEIRQKERAFVTRGEAKKFSSFSLSSFFVLQISIISCFITIPFAKYIVNVYFFRAQ